MFSRLRDKLSSMAAPENHPGEIQVSSEVLFRELQGEAVLLDLRSQRYFGLDEVGTRIWQLMAEHGRQDLVLEALLREFDVDQASLSQDVEEFLSRLQSAGLISISSSLDEVKADDSQASDSGADDSPTKDQP